MGPIQVVVTDANNLVLEVTPTPSTTVILDRGIAGPVGPQGPGDVDGPASATDNAVARFDGTTGKLIQNSLVTIADDGATVITTNSTSNALRITQTGTGNALLVEDAANPDSTPVVIDSGGRIIKGATTAIVSGIISNPGASTQIHGVTTFRDAALELASWVASTSSDSSVVFTKSPSGAAGTQTIVANNEALGKLRFGGSDGVTVLEAARIEAAVDGTPGTNDMPGRLVFSTTADGASSPTERVRINSTGNVLVGTTTNTNSSLLVVNGEISETVGGVQYEVVSQADIGSAPNEIPLNQYLGALAYEDTETPALNVGTGITTGTGTICKANGGLMGGIYQMTILIDLTGLNSGGTAGDIIGVNGTALPCYIAQLPAMTVLGGRMTCLETPAGGDTDIDLYSATEGTGVEDQAITALTETQIINAGTQALGTVTFFSADPTLNQYLYLVGQSTSNATYTAGRFLIEIFGVQ